MRPEQEETDVGPPLRPNEPRGSDPHEIPWVSDIVRVCKENPDVQNIYFEPGSTFGQTSAYAPELWMHMLGQMLQVPHGEERILWGTDSIWGGSPQSQIVRLRRPATPSTAGSGSPSAARNRVRRSGDTKEESPARCDTLKS